MAKANAPGTAEELQQSHWDEMRGSNQPVNILLTFNHPRRGFAQWLVASDGKIIDAPVFLRDAWVGTRLSIGECIAAFEPDPESEIALALKQAPDSYSIALPANVTLEPPEKYAGKGVPMIFWQPPQFNHSVMGMALQTTWGATKLETVQYGRLDTSSYMMHTGGLVPEVAQAMTDGAIDKRRKPEKKSRHDKDDW